MSFRRSSARTVALILGFGLAIGMSWGLAPDWATAQDSVEDARAEREQARRDRAAAAAELDAARAEDAELADALGAITVQVNAQQLRVDESKRQLDELASRRQQVAEDLTESDAEAAVLDRRLADAAISSFLSGNESALAVLEADDIMTALRQSELSSRVSAGTADLIDQTRTIREDQEVLRAEIEAAQKAEAEVEEELSARLGELGDAQEVQAAIKAEVEARVAVWEAEYADSAAEEAKLTAFIKEEERKAAAAAAAANPSSPSSAPRPSAPSISGFQWPISGPVTSEFGYRTHPIFKTRRLHTGLDISGSSGTPIAAANGGTVIFAGWRGGYGNCVIISHGGGISTLYGHQSKLAVSNGASVSRGDVIGYVGSTGQSTGPHLHFEMRSNGSPIDPRPYLP